VEKKMELENMSMEQMKAELEKLKPIAEEVKQKEQKQAEAEAKKKAQALVWWTDKTGKMAKEVEAQGVEVTLTHKDCVKFTDGTIVKWSGRGYRKIN
jgi:hypothetical protein